MKALLHLIEKGGPAMIAIIVLSVVLYSRCFKLLLALRRLKVEPDVLIGLSGFSPRSQSRPDGDIGLHPHEAHRLQEEIRESFRQQRIPLGGMIAAAPLLGLLGTVSGMVKTFESLSAKAGEKSMESLARGISEVLVATESGLLVALPALLLVYLAHREMNRHVQQLNRIALASGKEAAS